MKTYLINLDRSSDRLQWFMAQADALGLNVERVAAVEGSAIPVAEQLAYDAISPGERTLSPNELGCLLSHMEVWRRIVASPDRWAFVAEDDIHISPSVSPFVASDAWIPDGADLVKAETYADPVALSTSGSKAPEGRMLRHVRSFHAGSAGYFISQAGARAMLAFAQIQCEPVDHLLFWPSGPRKHHLRILQIDPAICIQDFLYRPAGEGTRFESTLRDERAAFQRSDPRSRKLRGLAKVPREIRRIVRRVAAKVGDALLAGRGIAVRKPVAFR